MQKPTDMTEKELDAFRNYARRELERCLEELDGSESPDGILLKMKGYTQRITGYRTADFMEKRRHHGN